MASQFSTYLQLGFHHILDPQAYDHILFVIALCAAFRPSDWRRIAVLVTAFTLGHSLTLALATLGILAFPVKLIELLIPITILLTAAHNIYFSQRQSSGLASSYGLAAGFGLVHGMGFSNFLRASMFPGQEDQLVSQLLAFNLGVELGQLCIVAAFLLISAVALHRLEHRNWNIIVSAGVGLLATYLLWSQLVG